MAILTTAIGATSTILGVMLGGALSRQGSEAQWLRDQRLKSYTAIVNALVALNRQFATEMRVSRLGGQAAIDAGQDVEGADWRWLDQLSDLQHLESESALLGGAARDVYSRAIDPVLADYTEVAMGDEEATEEDWDALVTRGATAVDRLMAAFRSDLRGHSR